MQKIMITRKFFPYGPFRELNKSGLADSTHFSHLLFMSISPQRSDRLLKIYCKLSDGRLSPQLPIKGILAIVCLRLQFRRINFFPLGIFGTEG